MPPKTIKERQAWIKSILDFANELEHGKKEKPAPVRKISFSAKQEKPAAAKPKPTAFIAGQSPDVSITTIKGISTSFAAKFSKLGVKTIRDLLYFFPSRHLDYSRMKTVSQLREGQEETIVCQRLGGENHDAGRTPQHRGNCRGRNRERTGDVVQQSVPGQNACTQYENRAQRQGKIIQRTVCLRIAGMGTAGRRRPDPHRQAGTGLSFDGRTAISARSGK